MLMAMVMTMVMAMMLVAMLVVMLVVRAAFRLPGQLAVQVGRNQRFDRLIGNPGYDVDAMPGKDGQGALADPADDDQFDAQALQPAGKRPRDMFGRGQRFGAQGGFGAWIHLDHRKVAAAAEMRIQATVFNRNCYFHYYLRLL
jgi:hypothetical protein